MKRALGTLVVAILCVAEPTQASESSARVDWVRSCLVALEASDAKVQASGSEAISRLGPAAAAVLARALGSEGMNRWRAWDLLTNALVKGGSTEQTAERIAGTKAHWPPTHAGGLAALVAELREASSTRLQAAEKILAHFEAAGEFSASDADVKRLADLGRPIIPVLLATLRHGAHRRGYADEAAAAALSSFMTEADVPLVAQLLRDGHLIAAGALRGRTSPAAKSALLAPLKKGLLNSELLDCLRAFGRDQEVGRQVVRWLKMHGRGGGLSTRDAAGYVAEVGVQSALPVLRSLLSDAALAADVRASIAASCAWLGDKRGIEALVGLLSDPSPLRETGLARYRAGRALNLIAGRRVYSGAYGDKNSNAADAAKWFETWWSEHSKTLSFDSNRGVWLQER